MYNLRIVVMSAKLLLLQEHIMLVLIVQVVRGVYLKGVALYIAK
jgi:hypothetical protein